MDILTFSKGASKQLSKNFNSNEFDCHGSRCCSETKVDAQLIEYLQQIRTFFGRSVTINSGYRCKTHNARVGGASKSNHMYGQAADIVVKGISPIEVARYAESIGVLGIGVYSGFVHIDTRTSKYFWYDGGASNVSTFGKLQFESPVSTQIQSQQEKTGVVSNNSDENAREIWNFLMDKIQNPYGVAGLMGNLYAESGLRSNNLQDSYELRLGYRDDTYTTAVDKNTYTNFIKDGAGYGLAQWTYWTRKKKLLEYAENSNKSIGDYRVQLEFLLEELKNNYASVLKELKQATNIRNASDAVLFNFENPANKSTSVQQKREAYGQTYYKKFAERGEEFATVGYAISNTAMHLRAANNTSAKSYGVIKKGTRLEVIEVLSNGWYKVKWEKADNGYAYTSNTTDTYYDYIPKQQEKTVKITANILNIRTGPSTSYSRNGYLSKNTVHTIIQEENGWGRLKSGAGWIKLSYTQEVNYNA